MPAKYKAIQSGYVDEFITKLNQAAEEGYKVLNVMQIGATLIGVLEWEGLNDRGESAAVFEQP